MYNQKMKCGAEKSTVTCWRLLRSHHICSLVSAKEVCVEAPDQHGEGRILLFLFPQHQGGFLLSE